MIKTPRLTLYTVKKRKNVPLLICYINQYENLDTFRVFALGKVIIRKIDI
jgi:hypothetical protein